MHSQHVCSVCPVADGSQIFATMFTFALRRADKAKL
jgi:hypothetical protein